MDASEAMAAAGFETTVFLIHFNDMPDHRQPGEVAYRLDEILLLSLLAVLAGAEGFTDIARFGQRKLALLRRFLPFVNGTPSHDHLGDIFATLDAEAFRRCFVAWIGALMKTPVELIAIDGKTSRRSGNKGAKDAIHMVSAFAARQRLVLACQSAHKTDPRSACKIDPPDVALTAALAPAELVGVAQPGRARGGEERSRAQARFLKRQLSLPVSTMSQ